MLGRRRAFALASGILVLAVLAAAVATTQGFSDGNAAAARSGCGPETGCHGVPGQPPLLVSTQVQGFPEAYEPGTAYDVTVAIEGAPAAGPAAANTGGFAIEATAGVFEAVDEAAQVVENRSATHTTAGNDQRAWSLVWVAPDAGAGDVQVWASANAVNGNGAPDPADLWTTTTLTVVEGAPGDGGASGSGNGDGNGTAPPDGSGGGDGAPEGGGNGLPGPSVGLLALAMGAGAALAAPAWRAGTRRRR